MSFEVELGERLRERGLTMATAESCSGGLIAHRITNVAGSSAYFLGGAVTYANAAKTRVLGVRPETLDAHGAVSEAVAREMVAGAKALFGADVAVAVTGIAGPGGGTAEKPVGLVYMAVAVPGGSGSERHQFSGDRASIKAQTADRALALALEWVAR